MPIYEYECEKCGRVEEVFQRFSDKPLTRCPHCPGALHKLVSRSAFHLTGAGWYVTDYARKDGARNAQADDKPASGGTQVASASTGGTQAASASNSEQGAAEGGAQKKSPSD